MGPEGAYPTGETGRKQGRIDPVHHDRQSATRYGDRAESAAGHRDGCPPNRHGVIVVAINDRPAYSQQKKHRHRKSHTIRIARVTDPRKMVRLWRLRQRPATSAIRRHRPSASRKYWPFTDGSGERAISIHSCRPAPANQRCRLFSSCQHHFKTLTTAFAQLVTTVSLTIHCGLI